MGERSHGESFAAAAVLVVAVGVDLRAAADVAVANWLELVQLAVVEGELAAEMAPAVVLAAGGTAVAAVAAGLEDV